MAEPIDLDADLESLGTLALRIADDRALLLAAVKAIIAKSEEYVRLPRDRMVAMRAIATEALLVLTVPQCFEPKREQRNG